MKSQRSLVFQSPSFQSQSKPTNFPRNPEIGVPSAFLKMVDKPLIGVLFHYKSHETGRWPDLSLIDPVRQC